MQLKIKIQTHLQNNQFEKINVSWFMDIDLLKNNKVFVTILIILQLSILVFYRFFYQVARFNDDSQPVQLQNNVWYYPMYQDINVMMLIGFGFLRAFLKFGAWSAIGYTFFINAIIVQYYLLWNSFWSRVMHGFASTSSMNFIREQNFTSASYSVASILIAFGVVLGRVGPYQLLIMAMIQLIAYTLNEIICYDLIQIYDAGGSMTIHTFGACFGLAASFVLGLKKKPGPDIKIEISKNSVNFAMIGTLFLWIFFPSFNAGFFAQNSQQKTLIISNTILALTGSCIGAFFITALYRQKFNMEDIMNATLAGGVIIAAPSGLFTNPAASLVCGVLAGLIAAWGNVFISKFLIQTCGLMDTCKVNNLHGIPGILGGILSAVAIAAYQTAPMDSELGKNLNFFTNTHMNRPLSTQAWYQILGLITSIGIGIVSGAVAGLLMTFSYRLKNRQFYRDTAFFQFPYEEQWLKQPMATSRIIQKPRSIQLVKIDKQHHSHEISEQTLRLNVEE